MQSFFTGIFAGAALVSVLTAQSVPEAEQIARLKINRTKYSEIEPKGIDLRERANTQNSDIDRKIIMFVDRALCTGNCPAEDDRNDWQIKSAVAQSDLVVIGGVKSQIATLTEHNGFVVTDSQFVVEEIVKPYASIPLKTELTVTTPGGTVYLDGHKITSTLSIYPTLQVGNQYLLFLKHLPDSQSYQPVDLVGFNMSGPTVVPMNTSLDMPEKKYLSFPPLFLDVVRTSAIRQIEEERK